MFMNLNMDYAGSLLTKQVLVSQAPEHAAFLHLRAMRSSLVRLAKSVSEKPLNLREAGATLLPPIPLYRGILRAHRLLPVDMRTLGDDYVKAEFRRHQEIDNPLHIIGFLSQWKMYLDAIPKDRDAVSQWRGRKLDPTVFEKMSNEQVGQLYELMHATKEVWKSAEELEAQAQDEEARIAAESVKTDERTRKS